MNFQNQFQEALAQLEADAKAAGTNLTAICKECGISRTTPDRWKQTVPVTVRLLSQMQDAIAAKRGKRDPEPETKAI